MTTTQAAETPNLLDRTFHQLVDGRLVNGAGSDPVIDPGTGEPTANAPMADGAQVDESVAAAARAFASWRETSFAERVAVVERLADAVAARADEIAEVITLETGKPLAMARELEVDAAIAWARHFATLSLEPAVLRDDEDTRIERHRAPLGVVAAIVPWNFPFFQTMYKVVPALLAGNTVVIEPAPTTPLNALLLGEILAELVPDGVVNVLGDAGRVRPALSAHPDVAKVSFTGSTAAGRQVMASGAGTIKRLVLELGGNDAAIVMPDADIPAAAADIATWAFAYAGQICVSIKRIYVPAGTYDKFCAAFARQADALVVGHGLDPSTTMGPIQNARQFETVKGYLRRAHSDGTVVAGGEVAPGPGYFVRPTVVRDIDETSPLIAEETFGPVRSILTYDDLDDAIARVNDTPFGLGNSVWGRDLEAAAAVARRLESGTVWVNTHLAIAPDVPYGGRKQSGLGVEFALDGLLEYTDTQIVHVAR